MKKLMILLAIIAIAAMVGCQKIDVNPPKGPSEVPGGGGNSVITGTFNWTGCKPLPIEELGKVAVSGYTDVYDYMFRIHLNGSQVDPNPLELNRFSIPHVGPGGSLIYSNVANDATYTINKIENGWVYYTIRSQIGHTLKYNISVLHAGNQIWFLKYGLAIDDNVNNIITFTTK